MSLRSSRVSTATTPGNDSALPGSIDSTTAWVSGLRRILASSRPAKSKSPVNFARPVTFAIPSMRRVGEPTDILSIRPRNSRTILDDRLFGQYRLQHAQIVATENPSYLLLFVAMLLQTVDQVRQVFDFLEAFDQLRLLQRVVAIFKRARAVVFDEIHAQGRMLDAYELDHVVHVL